MMIYGVAFRAERAGEEPQTCSVGDVFGGLVVRFVVLVGTLPNVDTQFSENILLKI